MDTSKTSSGHKLALSVDVEEWYHSRRWVDGKQARAIPDSKRIIRDLYGTELPIGEVVRPTLELLDLLDRYRCRATFFVLGEIGLHYPDLVREIGRRGHEIGCHGLRHVDVTLLGPDTFARELDESCDLMERLTGQRPVGYRAPNLVYTPWVTPILEERGFLYHSTVCASRSIGGKYKGWADAPSHPYRPSYEEIGRPGSARLVELPIPSFPLIKISAGSGILTRVIGYHWTATALRVAIRRGDTAFYFHPWELGPKPKTTGHRLRNALFLRRTGPWMMRSVERLLSTFEDRITTARTVAEAFLSRTGADCHEDPRCRRIRTQS